MIARLADSSREYVRSGVHAASLRTSNQPYKVVPVTHANPPFFLNGLSACYSTEAYAACTKRRLAAVWTDANAIVNHTATSRTDSLRQRNNLFDDRIETQLTFAGGIIYALCLCIRLAFTGCQSRHVAQEQPHQIRPSS